MIVRRKIYTRIQRNLQIPNIDKKKKTYGKIQSRKKIWPEKKSTKIINVHRKNSRICTRIWTKQTFTESINFFFRTAVSEIVVVYLSRSLNSNRN